MSIISVFLLCCCSQSATDAKFVLACFEGDYGLVVTSANERDLDVQVRVTDSNNGTIRNSDSWTALTAAIVGKQWHIASFLIGAGADVNQTTSRGYHSIWLLAEHGNGTSDALAVATLILEAGGKVDVTPDTTLHGFSVETALHRAVARLDVEMVKLLVANGANPDSTINGEPSIRAEFKDRFEELKLIRREVPKLVSAEYWDSATNLNLFLQKAEKQGLDKERKRSGDRSRKK